MIRVEPVVITGIGTVNGLGNNCEEFWQKLTAGQSAAAKIQSFDSSAWRTHIACEIKQDLLPTDYPERVYNLLMTAAAEAVAQAGGELSSNRTGVVLGSLLGGITELENHLKAQVENSLPIDIKEYYPNFLMSGLSRFLASHLEYTGPVATSGIACAASGAAMSRATDFIKLGYADAMITGGVDAFSQISFSGFNAMRSAASAKCRPFSKDREGLIIGEGAGILVLESASHAKKRGTQPLAVVLGTGLAEDAYHITAPDPSGSGAVRSMRAALGDAGLRPDEIDYVNAHGTGTLQNDRMETNALKTVFGDYVTNIPISSIKAAVGHCMGAAGAVEAVASVMTIIKELIPPTINFVAGDPECDLDYVPLQPRAKEVKTILSNSFGFGGNNASIIFGHPDFLEGRRKS